MGKTIQLDTKAVVTGVVTSLVVGGILGAIGYGRLTQFNTFRLDTQALAIEEVKKTIDDKLVTKEVYEINQKQIIDELNDLTQAVRDLDKAIK